ncbi:MAG: ral secretion pathway protein GspE [Crocinitomicaceae bacterium]|nr:ral secretion pathway protein GspE [Crocinitomicaceae bacterium]
MSSFNEIAIDPETQQLIRSDLAWHYRVIPKAKEDKCFVLWIDETADQQLTREELVALLGTEVELVPSDKINIQRALGKYYRTSNDQEQKFSFDAKLDFVDRLIQEANQLGSSDIHIEVFADRARVRMRVDGHLIQRYVLDKEDYPELINKVKIRSNLDISEKRLPQDGRIQYQDFDMRVSILPTLHGEKIVLRLLGHDASSLSMEKLGFSEVEKMRYLEGIKKPNGIILISGPTGSGKTTTLYATLKLLNDEKRNVVTVEDPIEYTLEGINQVQLKESIGLTFASALRSFLRQDPDVIMLGEIRDGETAQMAIRAALTGHLVLSTIHTNSAWGTISRLIDMGVPSFLLANTINSSVAQRLVRKLCTNCKSEVDLIPSDWPYGLSQEHMPAKHHVAVGCDQCHFTGYKGRIALYEVIPIDEELAIAIKNNDSHIQDKLESRGIKDLATRALEILTEGVTSLDEVYALLTGF